jgi:hypothetical protein
LAGGIIAFLFERHLEVQRREQLQKRAQVCGAISALKPGNPRLGCGNAAGEFLLAETKALSPLPHGGTDIDGGAQVHLIPFLTF